MQSSSDKTDSKAAIVVYLSVLSELFRLLAILFFSATFTKWVFPWIPTNSLKTVSKNSAVPFPDSLFAFSFEFCIFANVNSRAVLKAVISEANIINSLPFASILRRKKGIIKRAEKQNGFRQRFIRLAGSRRNSNIGYQFSSLLGMSVDSNDANLSNTAWKKSAVSFPDTAFAGSAEL
jgi:hypothetical protein